jgi:Peptidase C10 family/Right handed beta helix region/Spi protease inhibitor
MQFIMRSNVFVGILLVLGSVFVSTASADSVSPQRARDATTAFLQARLSHAGRERQPLFVMATGPTMLGDDVRAIWGDDGTVLAYVARLSPRGFVVTSANTNTPPIMAYSFRSSFPDGADDSHPLHRLLKEDMTLRLRASAEGDPLTTSANNALWDRYAKGAEAGLGDVPFQQWPQAETTSTGGWLQTAWRQDAPFNAFCPLDTVDGLRSYVGCVATAMAQVVHYHRLANVIFDAWDSYTTYSGIDIDADSERYDFPSFEELSELLAGVRLKYSQQVDLNDVDIAALSFACGVSAQMDYSSEGSGASPYDMQQALLLKFGFSSARMIGSLSPEFVSLLQENLANQMPVLLGMSPADGMGGHAVVCDGYNTDGEYHLNFGWGTPRPDEITEVWYRLPTDLPAYLSAVQEVVLDIRPVPPSIEVYPGSMAFHQAWGQPAGPKTLFLRNHVSGTLSINSVTSPPGFLISRWETEYSDHIDAFEITEADPEVALNVTFQPEAVGSYYGTLAIGYSDGKTRHIVLKGTSVVGGTQVQAGAVSGIWSAAGSPYYVVGDVNVPAGSELVVEPGVGVFFMGPYALTVGRNARFVAEGTPGHPIEFTAGNKRAGWKGLRFIDTGDDDVLRYCSITYGKKGAGLMGPWGAQGGSAQTNGGALYCSGAAPTIAHCKITNNIGDRAGAIYCVDSDLIISNTLIANNTSQGGSPQGGGVCCEGIGAVQIKSCTIANNAPGGVFSASSYGTEVTNSIFWGNGSYQIQSHESVAVVSYSDVQDGCAGEGNLEVDPCFFDPSAGAGVDHDGLVANWTLQSGSPCINAGADAGLTDTDLAGDARVYSQRVDLGAYENQSDLPLLSLAPAGSLDAGAVHVGTVETMALEITNTGKLDFEIESVSLSDPRAGFTIETPIRDQALSPGDSLEVEIDFAPLGERMYTGMLDVFSTSSNAPHKQVPLCGLGVSGTLIPGGEVRGPWTKAESPYVVTGDIEVARDQELTIEPGVVVKFAGHFSLTVGYRATLVAAGTEPEPIVFTAIDTDEGWFGLRFVDSGDDDVLQYCTIEHAKKRYSGGSLLVDLLGGGILCCGGANMWMYTPSSPMIDHCVIANNDGAYGGGIVCIDDSEAVIRHCRIVDNSSGTYGGGIWVYYAYPTISHNIIAHNSAWMGGGISNYLGLPSITNNTIVHNRPNGLELDQAMWSFWDPQPVFIANNILWDNEIYMWQYASAEDYNIRFNDIQGGWDGDGNIDVDPRFVRPENREYRLKSQAGRWDPEIGDWLIDEASSPCIDAGDPQSPVGDEQAPHGALINMGAYGGTPQASKTP